VRKEPELINDCTVYKNTALHYAALRGRTSSIEFLVKNDARRNPQNLRGDTRLHIALRQKHFEAAKALIAHISPDEINAKNDRGWTLLHVSCAVAGVDLVQQLVAAGATLNLPDYSGLTPIQWCQHYKKDDVTKAIQDRLVRDAPTFTLNPPLFRSSIRERYFERCIPIALVPLLGVYEG
jgi:ankyrin repeat protein